LLNKTDAATADTTISTSKMTTNPSNIIPPTIIDLAIISSRPLILLLDYTVGSSEPCNINIIDLKNIHVTIIKTFLNIKKYPTITGGVRWIELKLKLV
jgi:hypothetical protein